MAMDYSEFSQLRDKISNMENSFSSWLNLFMLNIGLEFIARVKLRTPVDTGDLRNHWQLDGTPVREGDNIVQWFVNAMNYATHVEYGHAKPYKAGAVEGSKDWVDGYFMMTIAIEEIERKLPAKFDAQFKQWVSGLGVE